MWKRILKISLRNYINNKVYFIINTLGLSVGFAAFILIMLYVQYEKNWDRFHENADEIYRVEQIVEIQGGNNYWNQTPGPLALALKNNFPEISHSVTLREIWDEFVSSSKELTFKEYDGYFVDGDLFDVFTFEFIQGIKETSLDAPYNVIVSESFANKYFPDGNAFGKTLTFRNAYDYKITGIYKDFPDNSHAKIDYLVPFETFKDRNPWDMLTDWGSNASKTYIWLNKKISKNTFEKKIASFCNQYTEKQSSLKLKPLVDIHLLPDDQPVGKIILYLYTTLAIMTLTLVGINFINLTTAYSGTRSKEIGIKKVSGAQKPSLILYFLMETITLVFISLVLAFTFAELCLPVFNNIVSRSLDIKYVDNSVFIAKILLVSLSFSVLAGIYPAIIISSFNPIKVLKAGFNSNQKGKKITLRKILVVFQLFIASYLGILTLSVFQQIHFMKNKDIGFNKENILVTEYDPNVMNASRSLKNIKSNLINHTDIIDVSFTYNAPYISNDGRLVNWEGSEVDDVLSTRYNRVDPNYVNTYQMEIIEGRNFSPDLSTDIFAMCLVNEAFVDATGWQNPIGKKVWDNQYTIIGVVKDFHPYSSFIKIPPYLMLCHDDSLSYTNMVSIKLSKDYNKKTIDAVKAVFADYFPDQLFDFYLLDDVFEAEAIDTYNSISKTSGFFTCLTIILSIVGIFGLISFAIKTRSKEIGIRKVMGAKSSLLLRFFLREFLVLVFISLILSIPLSIMLKSMDPAYYKPEFKLWPIIVISLATIIITVVTIIYHVIKASYANPVDSIRDE